MNRKHPSFPIFDRRRFVQSIATGAAGALVPGWAMRNAAADDAVNPFAKDQVDAAVDRAIKVLLQIQQRGRSGAIYDRRNPVTMTSLAIMAMAGVGVQPNEPSPRGVAMRKALDFVLQPQHQDREGYFGRSEGSRMYGHGITTLMLTEMVGMGVDDEQDRLIAERLDAAINLILASQKTAKRDPRAQGGWRYEPNARDSDLSITVWQLMALRSAKNDGMDIPASAIDEAVGYLENSYTSRLDRSGMPREDAAGFSYTPDNKHPTFTMTSAGLLAMQVCGRYESPMVRGAAEWLLQRQLRRRERFFMYGVYYYSQGMHQRGGKYAIEARKRVEQILLEIQRPDGSWIGPESEEAKW
ncbi:MAG: prenyltransferase/squalene oxidase repeat-containing protein, partial [Planctomycetota bacterium]